MNKRYFLLAIGFILVAALNAGYAYAFKLPFSKSEGPKEISKAQPQKQTSQDYGQLEKKYETLFKEKEHIQRDRDNILEQIKILLKEKEIYQNARGSIEKLKEENKALGEEIKAANANNISLSEEIANLKIEQEKALREKEEGVKLLQESIASLKEQMNKGARSKILKKLKEERASLKKEKKDLTRSLKQSERKIDNGEKREEKLNALLVDTENNLDKLQDEFAQLQEVYKALLLDNKGLRNDLAKMPKKFAEMAYENQKLIKQTATLHYNTGVFYFLHKGYKLAVQEFTKALEICPDDANTHYNLGFIYAENLVDKPKAIKHFKEYLRITKGLDEYADKAKQYILVWETYREKEAK
ncbi:MAG: tetratricopeptide repeat protein [Candidatus Omnitrophica bacterium]|nr:tetratricopeptide repeat protein [Candidatus Omnitrophota bacterium]